MQLTDTQLAFYDSNVLKIQREKRTEFIRQVDFLIGRLKKKIDADTSFSVKRFIKTGSLMKGTVLKPRGDWQADADIAVELDVTEADRSDIEKLHHIILKLLIAVYPQKSEDDFEVQPRTLGLEFIESGLCVDLVPIVPILAEPGYAWQPSSKGEPPVKTNIDGQLKFVKARHDSDPRYRPIVRLLKGWKREHELPIGSFAIELITAYLLDKQGAPASLEEGLLRFFLFVAQGGLKERLSFPENGRVAAWPNDPVVILDPVNATNNITRRITDAERQEVVSKATEAWERLWTASQNNYKTETVELWKQVFGRNFRIE
jgi:hypothetical protein